MTRRRKYLWLLLPFALLAGLWLLLSSNWGVSWGLRIAAAMIPGQLSVRENHGSLLSSIHLQGLRYSNGQVSVSIQRLDLNLKLRSLLRGRLAVEALAIDDIRIDVLAQPATPDTPPSTQQKAQAGNMMLPMAMELAQARIDKLQIHIPGNDTPILIDHIRVSASGKHQTLDIRQALVQAYQSELNGAGTLSLADEFPLKLKLALAYHLDATHQLNGSGTLSGNLQSLHLVQKISGMAQADLIADVKDVLSTLKWQAQLALTHLDIHEVTAHSPAILVQGKLTASGDLDNMRGEGRLQVADKRLGQAQVQLQADSDILLSAYRFQATADVSAKDLPAAQVSVQGKGDLQHVELSQLVLHALKGDVRGAAHIAWSPRFALTSDLNLQELQTGALFEQWPGRISAQLSLQAEATANGVPLKFKLQNLAGNLRGYPLQAEAIGSVLQDQFALDKLQLTLGGTTLSAQGQLAQQWDFRLHAHSDDLASLVPEAKGKFALDGRLTGTATLPRLTLTGAAEQLAYADDSLAALNVKLDLGLARSAVSQLELQASDVQTNAGHWNQLQLQVSGSNAAQHISLAASDAVSNLHAQWHGAFEPWRWQGSLDSLRVSQRDFGVWQLQQPVTIALAQGQIKLSLLCLRQAESHLCAQLQWNHSQRHAHIDGKNVPLSFVEPWLPQNVQLRGQLDVQGSLDLTKADRLQASLHMQSADKSIVIDFRDVREQLNLGASSLTAELNSKGLHAALHLPLSGGGGIDSEISMPGWSPQRGFPQAQPVTASLNLDHLPADIIPRFTTDLVRGKGYLQVNMQVNGSLGKPNLRGTAQWHDGSILVPLLGVNVHDIRAELKSERFNTLLFTLQARSGDGDAQLDGRLRLDPAQGWPTELTLTSHNLEVSNIPEAFVLVDSKIKVLLQGNKIAIDGDITVPRASFKPHTLPEDAVPVSPDIVIIRSEKQAGATARWLLSTRLRVQLGDQVDFNGFRTRAKLRGNVLFNDEPGKLATAQGELSVVDGIYRLSGQELTIRRGRLIFSNTFIDDPALDVEAVRKIDTVTAGVRLKGTLKQPQLTVFSEPVMPETEALSYLVLGHGSSQSTAAEGKSVSASAAALGFVAGDYLEKGIGGRLGLDELRVDINQTTQNTSLIMGKYLSPKLILRYYTGIADSSRLLQLQYQVSKRIQIQTESGYTGSQSTTGGDIFFTIEY